MIIIEVMGGLGNQLQQYALYQKMKSLGKDAKLDLSWFSEESQRKAAASRKPELLRFTDLPMDVCTQEEKEKIVGRGGFFGRLRRKLSGKNPYFYESGMYHPEIFDMDNVCLSGYWACEKYYADILPMLRETILFPGEAGRSAETVECAAIGQEKNKGIEHKFIENTNNNQNINEIIENKNAGKDNNIYNSKYIYCTYKTDNRYYTSKKNKINKSQKINNRDKTKNRNKIKNTKITEKTHKTQKTKITKIIKNAFYKRKIYKTKNENNTENIFKISISGKTLNTCNSDNIYNTNKTNKKNKIYNTEYTCKTNNIQNINKINDTNYSEKTCNCNISKKIDNINISCNKNNMEDQSGENPLELRNARTREEMKNRESVSIHLRRGDYLDPGNAELFGGICTDAYYESAVRYILERYPDAHFYVFSDDSGYARAFCERDIFRTAGRQGQKTLLEPEEERESMLNGTDGADGVDDADGAPAFPAGRCTVVDWNTGENSLFDMQLMKTCRHNICANSTFSFWGARLNPGAEKIMIRPLKHKNSQTAGPEEMKELWAGWVLIDEGGKVVS